MHDGKAEMTTQRLEDRWDAIVLGAGAGGLFTAARLAAVQALYQMDVAGSSLP